MRTFDQAIAWSWIVSVGQWWQPWPLKVCTGYPPPPPLSCIQMQKKPSDFVQFWYNTSMAFACWSQLANCASADVSGIFPLDFHPSRVILCRNQVVWHKQLPFIHQSNALFIMISCLFISSSLFNQLRKGSLWTNWEWILRGCTLLRWFITQLLTSHPMLAQW